MKNKQINNNTKAKLIIKSTVNLRNFELLTFDSNNIKTN